MSKDVRTRDAGLQPERTALAWHRTLFAASIFSLAAVRIAFTRGDLLCWLLSSAGAIVALALAAFSFFRHGRLDEEAATTLFPLLAKSLLSTSLCLIALALALPVALDLLKGILLCR